MRRPSVPLYGLDVAARTAGEPGCRDEFVVAGVGLVSEKHEYRFSGAEAEILAELDDRLTGLPTGILVTWNGSLLALPLLARRAERFGLSLGLRMRVDRRQGPPALLPGVDTPVCGAWGAHRHLDLHRLYRAEGPRSDETDLPSTDEFCPHDPVGAARLARSLADRRWSRAHRFVDRVTTVSPSSDRVTTATTESVPRHQHG